MKHVTVLLHESIDTLALRQGDIFVDGTLGGGGHSAEVCKRHSGAIVQIGIDLDADAIARSEALMESLGCTIRTARGNYAEIDRVLDEMAIPHIDKALLDLGLSSFQIEDSGRGFSFQKDEPLLMTMAKEGGEGALTAHEIVNEWDEENIEAILSGYGEERFSRRIAKAIVSAREEAEIKTTFDVVAIIESVVPKRGGMKVHPATKTFQALRIAVNDELRMLEHALERFANRLAPGGRLAVISFHSLEDRIVKRFFKTKEEEGMMVRITKKPIIPGETEVSANRRSRSAKLRVAEKK